MKNNQQGFGVLGVLLVVVVLGVVGGTGWYVGQRRNAAPAQDQAANQKQETQTAQEPADKPADETADWLLYESPGNEYKIRFADGWTLSKYTESLSLIAYGDLTYKPGVKATVTETTGGRGGPFLFSIVYSNQDVPTKRGQLLGEFKTNSGLVGQHYEFIQNEEGGHDIQVGEKEYTYYFHKNGKYVVITHAVYGNNKDQKDIVDKVVRTLQIP